MIGAISYCISRRRSPSCVSVFFAFLLVFLTFHGNGKLGPMGSLSALERPGRAGQAEADRVTTDADPLAAVDGKVSPELHFHVAIAIAAQAAKPLASVTGVTPARAVHIARLALLPPSRAPPLAVIGQG